MAVAKVAITLDRKLLSQVDGLVQRGRFSNRSQAIQAAVRENLHRWERRRLVQEVMKLDTDEERGFAEEVFTGESPWPEY